jgi:phenylalanyl-tRNA synthetase alpha chain
LEKSQIDMKELHPIETKILNSIENHTEISLTNLNKKTHLSMDQIRRGLEWLKFKNIIEYSKPSILLSLDILGKISIEKGLPERRLINAVQEGNTTITKVLENGFLTQNEINIAIAKARANKWIELINTENAGLTIKPTDKSKTESEEELLLKKIFIERVIKEGDLSNSELNVLKLLLKRPHLITIKKDEENINLTELGKKIKIQLLTEKKIQNELIATSLLSEHLVTGKWKEIKFRPIDVEANVPMAAPGRIHPLTDLINEIREAFNSLGFIEIEGDYVQSAFWNFDALFTPQDHAAREMQDTFYLINKTKPTITNKKLIKNIADIHLKGWKYNWDIQKAKKFVLRTHTTPITLKYLAESKPDEARIFTIGRVFRNEKVSYKHLVEFNQIEGVVTGKNITLRDLMGIQKEFYKKIGIKKIKFWPTYFPYTEPSLQSMIYNDDLKKWIELFGMGIFRPEVVEPLGIKNLVLAWGGGIERIAMLKYGLSDVRELYANKLAWLRSLIKCQ